MPAPICKAYSRDTYILVKWLPLPIAGKLRSKNRLDILRIARKYTTQTAGRSFESAAIDKPALPGFEVLVCNRSFDAVPDEVDICNPISISHGKAGTVGNVP